MKTSLAPGSKVVTEYLRALGPAARPRGARLPRRRLRLHDLHRQLRARCPSRVVEGDRRAASLVAAAVLSGNRNFEGRVNPRREGQLPGLAAAGRRLRARRHDGHRPRERAARHGQRRQAGLPARHLADAGGGRRRSRPRSAPRCSARATATCSTATRPGTRSRVAGGRPRTPSATDSTYIQEPPFFQGLTPEPAPVRRHRRRARAGRARRLGDDRPHLARRRHRARAARRAATCRSTGVEKKDFNSYGARRGNDRVMVRGTFANIRLKNLLVPGVEGGVTVHLPDGRADGDLRRGRALPGRGHAARRARRQGVRHRLARATGPPRARCCSACAP